MSKWIVILYTVLGVLRKIAEMCPQCIADSGVHEAIKSLLAHSKHDLKGTNYKGKDKIDFIKVKYKWRKPKSNKVLCISKHHKQRKGKWQDGEYIYNLNDIKYKLCI